MDFMEDLCEMVFDCVGFVIYYSVVVPFVFLFNLSNNIYYKVRRFIKGRFSTQGGYKEFKRNGVVFRLYEPQTRTIFYLGRYYYLYFPALLFAREEKHDEPKLYAFIAIDKELYMFPFNGFSDGTICLGAWGGKRRHMDDLIERFWTSEFTSYDQIAIGRLRLWERMHPDDVNTALKKLRRPRYDGGGCSCGSCQCKNVILQNAADLIHGQKEKEKEAV